MAKSMYDIIKKQNGEHFAKAIRNYDNGIFDIPNIDKIVKYAGRDAEPIMNYLISLKQIKIQEMAVHMDPIALLDKAGYNAYIADTLEKQNAIKQYYAPGEEICTFRDKTRFERYYIINAVRKDVDKIKRGEPPQRDDAYGTSVISIQVLKSGGFISIKNRYNHTVSNCDNTLNSNPDNIITGLSDAIKHHFNVDFSSRAVELAPGYTLIGNQICKYYREINNVYVSEDFYIKDGRIYEIDKSTQISLGNGLIFDLKHDPRMARLRDVTNSTGTFNIDALINNRPIRIEKNTDGSKALYASDEHILSYQDGKICYINPKNLGDFSLPYANLRGNLDFSHIGRSLSLRNCDLAQATSLKLPINHFFEFNGIKYYTDIDLEGATLPTVELDFSDFQGNLVLKRADLSRVKKLVLPAKETIMDLSGTKMPACDLDLGRLTQVMLTNSDLSRVTKLILPKNAKYIDLDNAILPECVLDLSNIHHFSITGADLSRVIDFKLPINLKEHEFHNIKFPVCDLNLSTMLDIRLSDSDLSRVKKLNLPKAPYSVYLDRVIMPICELDFSDVFYTLTLEDADLSHVKKLVMPKTSADVYATGAKFPACELDLSHIATDLNFRDADLSHVTKLTMPLGFHRIFMEGAIFPACELDFSGIKGTLELRNADLSRVKKLVLPKNQSNVDLEGAKLPKSFIFESAAKNILQQQNTTQGIQNVQNTNDTYAR